MICKIPPILVCVMSWTRLIYIYICYKMLLDLDILFQFPCGFPGSKKIGLASHHSQTSRWILHWRVDGLVSWGDKKSISQAEDVGVSKNMGKPPNHPFKNRVFHYKSSILGGKIPLFLETSMSFREMLMLAEYVFWKFISPCTS